MYLKTIEIHGFKSFANKIVFDFHNGITGIVGPNGSGKSNVADAVRWVLGEQKVKQLRSSSMQDVIFAGTENRKPLSFAYVAITLDNSDHKLDLDYNEVTVARRVYRSGESEYLLNGTACRLKDIHELFYDTGIGKEGYSIIGQGQIDKILSGKPEDRRELFDEAAGIVKYKRRKAAAQKKLEDEQQNLLRVNDILAELDRRVGPLGRQADQARIYLKKKEELKTLDVNMFLNEMERMAADEKSLSEKTKIAEDQQRETSEEYERIKRRYEELEHRIEDTDQTIGDLQQQISDADVEREKLDGERNVLKEQIRSARQSEAHVQERVDAIAAEIEKRQNTGREYTEEAERLEKELEQRKVEEQKAIDALQEIQNRSDHKVHEIEDGKAEVIRLLNERASLKAELQKCKTTLEQVGIRRSQINQRLLTHKSTESDVAELLEQREQELEALNQKILDLEKKKIRTDQDRRKWKTQENELRGKMDELRQNYHRDASRLESMKNIAERYDGYGNSIRKVMEQKATEPGILGVVADLFKVEKKYETAIETALGGSIQNIVTDNENTAKKMIEFLKRNRFGRATFLPITAVKGFDNANVKKALGERGVIGLADTLIRTDEKYQGIAASLLGRVLVVDTIDHATALARKFHYSLRIVTLEGELLQAGGSMTGGAFKNSSNLLGRSREIEALEKTVASYKETAKELRNRLEDVNTAAELLKEELEEIQEELQERYLNQNTLQVEVEHMKSQKEEQEQFYQSLQDEMDEIAEEEQQVNTEKDTISTQLLASSAREKEIAERRKVLNAEVDVLKSQIADAENTVADQKLQIAQTEQKITFVHQNIQRVAEEIMSYHRNQQEILLNASNSKQTIEEMEERIREISGRMDAIQTQKEQLGQKLEEQNGEKNRMSVEYKGFFTKREALSEELSQLDKELFRLNDRKEKLEKQSESLTTYMWDEYELTLHLAMKYKTEETCSTSELKKQIAAVKEEIRKLGNVNVNAIEEFREVEERYTFLHAQHADLTEAEKSLQDIIRELDDGMRKQFSEKFAEIQTEFDRAFKELFGGGKGSLELTMGEDTSDLLDCGVKIIAQPPGKKLQNMMQLSGGEKALTAIALLFAIQNLKPSPFCLLDEIEAALDDSNVDRFAKYLHKLTENTQFIVITHRRGTMTAADRLFGITMQEKGISTLVSVNLIENELDA